jgi:hypothetical protein
MAQRSLRWIFDLGVDEKKKPWRCSRLGLGHEHGIYAYILECARRYATPLLSLDGPQCGIARKLGIEVLEVES